MVSEFRLKGIQIPAKPVEFLKNIDRVGEYRVELI
nr:MAG TPA: hypothetical protein [Caudoviricetes sp.]